MGVFLRFRPFVLGALGSAALVAAGCHGNVAQIAGCPSTKISNNGVPQLLYPINGTHGVSDTLAAILIGFNGTASQVKTLELQAPGGPSVAIGPVLQRPPVLPSPMASPPSGWQTYSVQLPTLTAHTPYALSYTYATSYNSCNGQQTTTSPVGQFTTQ
jgi:hypothetical protein